MGSLLLLWYNGPENPILILKALNRDGLGFGMQLFLTFPMALASTKCRPFAELRTQAPPIRLGGLYSIVT